jgi:hypothetical protein
MRSRGSDGLGAGRSGFDSQQGHNFSLLRSVQTDSGADPAPYTMGTVGVFHLGLKRQGPEADHSPPSSAEVKNGEAIPPQAH